jgi:protein-L-isoaspartate O-methyltransferase
LEPDKGECALGFDRIYIGAAIEKNHLSLFKKMLKPGGILVGPGTFQTSFVTFVDVSIIAKLIG